MAAPSVLIDLLKLPTAAFLESAIMRYVEDALRGLPGIQFKYDRHRNLLAHYRHKAPKRKPLVFVAHTDHPGFVAQEMTGPHTLRAAFRGGVKPEYFAGARVRFWSHDRWVKGRVLKLSKVAPSTDSRWSGRPEEALLRVAQPIDPNVPGMWDVPGPTLRGDLLHACACDDLAGAAAMLELLRRLSSTHAAGEVYCLFTRAEEVGFVGAIAAARSRTIPRHLPVISIETSSVLPHAPIGAGPILRVGDRATVFSPQLIAYCGRVAQDLARRDPHFAFQRKLMDGGTCEAYPFLAYEYEAAGICVALGNYHNMNTRREKIAAEHISLKDWLRMVDWFEALVLDRRGPIDEPRGMRLAVEQRFRQSAALLSQPWTARRL